MKRHPGALQLESGSSGLPGSKRSVVGFEGHRVRRLLCCGFHDNRDLGIFQETLAAVDGDVDFVFLHTTDPELVEDYRRRFSPDFVVLANEEPAATASIHRLRTVVQSSPKKPQPDSAAPDRFNLEGPLTERQIAILQYLRNSCTNRKIAE